MADAAEALFPRMDRPTPRNMLGSALLDLATACADVSDGLLADLGHILERSGVSGSILWEAMPVSSALRSLSPAAQQEAALTGGDDYELVFTAPPSAALRIEQAGPDLPELVRFAKKSRAIISLSARKTAAS